MLYSPFNVLPGTRVTDLDTRQKIERVLRIDTDAGEVQVSSKPVRADPVTGLIVTEVIRFSAVWPIHDRGIPCAFHCHGRLN